MEVVPGCYQVVPEVPAFPDDYDDDKPETWTWLCPAEFQNLCPVKTPNKLSPKRF